MSETEKEKQAAFVFEQGQKRLDSGLSSYDAIAGKAFMLLTVSVPLVALLIGYSLVNASLASPFFYAAWAYAIALLASSWVLWKVVTVSSLYHNGRRPSEYLKNGIKGMTMTDVYEAEATELERSIADNKRDISHCSDGLRLGMRLFLLAPLAGLSVLAVCGSILFFQSSKVNLCPRDVRQGQEFRRVGF